MQPVPKCASWFTRDLTQGLIHRITEKDGQIRYVVLFPKAWEKAGEPVPERIWDLEGKIDVMHVQNYRITAWEERELVLAAPA